MAKRTRSRTVSDHRQHSAKYRGQAHKITFCGESHRADLAPNAPPTVRGYQSCRQHTETRILVGMRTRTTAIIAGTTVAASLIAAPAVGTSAEPAETKLASVVPTSFPPKKVVRKHKSGVILVRVTGIPKTAKATVRVTRRTPHFKLPRKKSNRLEVVRRVKPYVGRHYAVNKKTGYFTINGRPVRANGTVYKTHTVRVWVNRHHGVRTKLRYYPTGHKHHPVPGVNAPTPGGKATPLPQPSASASPTPTPSPSASATPAPSASATPKPTPSSSATPTTSPKPAIAFPNTGAGQPTEFSMGKGAWKQCKITWSFDPGPTAQLGADPNTELQLMRGVMNSIEKLANYQLSEVQSGGEIKIRMLDHLAGFPTGKAPAGITVPSPQTGAPFNSALISLNGGMLLGKTTNPGPDIRQNLYAHEIGHAFGLGHVTSPEQIMNATVPVAHGWGNGDLAGLAQMPSTCP